MYSTIELLRGTNCAKWRVSNINRLLTYIQQALPDVTRTPTSTEYLPGTYWYSS